MEGVFCILLGATTVGIPVEEVPAASLAGVSVVLLSIFSLFVQMAEGSAFSIVPVVNRVALGVIAGLVGAGGNLGSVVTEKVFFSSEALRTDVAFVHMGAAIIVTAPLALLLYFPAEGGGLVAKGGWGNFDPQLVKPPEGYRGADSMDYSATTTPCTSPATTPGNSLRAGNIFSSSATTPGSSLCAGSIFSSMHGINSCSERVALI